MNEEGISSLFVVGRQAPRISAEEESMSVPYHNQTAHYSHAFQLSYPNLTISLTSAFAPFNTFFASSGSSSSRERCNLSNLRPLMSRVATGTSSAGHSTIGLVLGKSKTKLEIVNNNSSSVNNRGSLAYESTHSFKEGCDLSFPIIPGSTTAESI